MANKQLLITGASGGLGLAVTQKLLDDGWDLQAAVTDDPASNILRDQFPAQYGKSLHAVKADLTEVSGVRDFISGYEQATALVHLAGGFRPGVSLGDSRDEDFDFLINLNARSAFLLLKAVMPQMIRLGEGSIVTIGARPVLHPVAGNAAYAASKAALVSLTLSAAEEGRPYGVRANCILPAVIRTQANIQGVAEKEWSKWTPPEDIAGTVCFLVSSSAKGLTGMRLPMYHRISA